MSNAFVFRVCPVCLNISLLLEQLTLCLKVTALKQCPVVLSDVLIAWHGCLPVSQARESHRLLVEQRLQSQVPSSTVVQHKD